MWLQLSLTICGLLEVDVGIAQGAAGDHIPADPNGQYGASRAELLIEHGLGDIGVQVPHVQRGHGVTAGSRVHLPLGALNHGGVSLGVSQVKPLININSGGTLKLLIKA